MTVRINADEIARLLAVPREERAPLKIRVSGPRNSGKSRVALEIAEKCGGYVMSSQPHAQISALTETVFDEIALGLETSVASVAELEQRVQTVAELVGVEYLLDCSPLKLSGGQTQLVVLASYLVLQPGLLVIDEPLSGLDVEVRARVLQVLAEYGGDVLWTAARFSADELAVATHRVELGGDGNDGGVPGRVSGGDSGFSTVSSAGGPVPHLLEVRELAVAPERPRRRRRARTGAGNRPVQSGLNFSVAPGEILVLRGANGSGKTTLLRTLAGLVPSVSGEVLVGDATDIARLDPAERVKLACLVAQHPGHHFVASSVAKELEVGPAGALDSGRKRDLLALAGLADVGKKNPHDLSPVEQHLLALVTAVAGLPSCLLVDEPTARVDNDGVQQTARIVRTFCEWGGSVVLATHDEELTRLLPQRTLWLGCA